MQNYQRQKQLNSQRYKLALKTRFLSLLWGFDPPWGLKYPQGTPGLIPLSLCIFSATNQNTDFVCDFCSFLIIFLHCNFFWPLLNPTLFLMVGLGSPYGPKSLNLSCDCWISQKTDLHYWFFYGFEIFLLLWSFLAIFDLGRASGGP